MRCKTRGKMPEWSIGTVSKTVVPLRVPRVRIPVFPQKSSLQGCFFCIRKDGMRTLEGSLSRSALRSRDSLSFRKKAAPQGCFFCIWKDGMRTLEGSLPRSALRSIDSLSFRKKSSPQGCFFLHQERRDENPGRFVTAQRFGSEADKEIAERSAKQRIPVFYKSLYYQAFTKPHPILHPEMAVILGVLLPPNNP